VNVRVFAKPYQSIDYDDRDIKDQEEEDSMEINSQAISEGVRPNTREQLTYQAMKAQFMVLLINARDSTMIPVSFTIHP